MLEKILLVSSAITGFAAAVLTPIVVAFINGRERARRKVEDERVAQGGLAEPQPVFGIAIESERERADKATERYILRIETELSAAESDVTQLRSRLDAANAALFNQGKPTH